MFNSYKENVCISKICLFYTALLKLNRIICVGIILFLSILTTAIYYGYQYFYIPNTNTFEVKLYPNEILFETDERFLSVALDTSFMACMFHQLKDRDWQRLEGLSKLLSPAYLRLGGTPADQLIFTPGDDGSFVENKNCVDIQPNEKISLTGKDWIKINEFAENSNLSFIMNLNVLLRSKSKWNASNAKSLIEFSEQNGFQLDFQLGNEPNSFPHVFNLEISGSQLAEDFYTLRRILKSTRAYRNSKLIGPDVTRPKNLAEQSLKYLREFLKKDVVDVASWHQYYLNGRTATLEDFMNPKTFDLLPPQIEAVKKTVREFSPTLPIWLSETSSAYGGGALKLSNRFAGSFLWLDKLGLAAKSGISVVIRQSLLKDHYALITDLFIPSPDFWISLLYKKLVGIRVLNVTGDNNANDLRLYAHCLSPDSGVNGNIVIFGLNLKNQTELLNLSNVKIKSPIHAYIFKPELNNLKAKSVLLNDKLLVYNETEVPDLVKMSEKVELPLVFGSHSIGFWALTAEETACGA